MKFQSASNIIVLVDLFAGTQNLAVRASTQITQIASISCLSLNSSLLFGVGIILGVTSLLKVSQFVLS
jgi:hypothetical protein